MRVREKPKGCLPARFCGLARVKAAPDETGDAELLKVGETLNGNPEPSPVMYSSREGVATRRAAPKLRSFRGREKG
jgi:hypothetical protein